MSVKSVIAAVGLAAGAERKTTGPETWSLDVRPVEDVKVWLGNTVLPILATDPAACLEMQ